MKFSEAYQRFQVSI